MQTSKRFRIFYRHLHDNDMQRTFDTKRLLICRFMIHVITHSLFALLALYATVLFRNLLTFNSEVAMQNTQDKDKYPTTFRISDGLRKRLNEAAHIQRTTKNQFVIDALEAAVNETIKGDKQ